MLKAELFLRWSKDELAAELDKMMAEMHRQGLITISDDECISIRHVPVPCSFWLPVRVRRCSATPLPSGC
jgi:hypothetical protein